MRGRTAAVFAVAAVAGASMLLSPRARQQMLRLRTALPPDSEVAAVARQFVAANVGQPDGDLMNSEVSWAPYITDFTYRYGTLRVPMALDRHSVEGKSLGPMAAKAIAEFIRDDTGPTVLRNNVHWVATLDKHGDYLGQSQVCHDPPLKPSFWPFTARLPQHAPP